MEREAPNEWHLHVRWPFALIWDVAKKRQRREKSMPLPGVEFLSIRYSMVLLRLGVGVWASGWELFTLRYYGALSVHKLKLLSADFEICPVRRRLCDAQGVIRVPGTVEKLVAHFVIIALSVVVGIYISGSGIMVSVTPQILFGSVPCFF